MEDTGSDNIPKGPIIEKSYFDVLGLCCSSEVPLIEKILKPLKGIEKVTVIVPSKTVIVVHDCTIITQLQIVKALNQAKLEASIRLYGTENKIVKKWPSPYIMACGVLLLASFLKHFFNPLKWLAVAAAVIGLPPIMFRCIAALRRFTLDINILMVIAVGGAIALNDYSEAGFIVFLLTIAEWLNSRASHKATAGMSTLMSMAPQKAILANTGKVVDAQSVAVGTILAVKAGELVPIDGVVVEGRSEVNESSLTGESFPVAKQPESLVWAGTLNVDGYISVKTTALAENSAVAKMARLVEDAQNNRSKTQRLIDSFAKYYTPAVVVIAAGIVVIPLLLKVHNRKHWFQLALVLLVSACPCALVLSTPVATFCALLTAARIGLLVKGGDVLEALAKTKVVAFDKTGTITMGEFRVTDFHSISHNVSLNKLLYWVSSIESKSSHPMASTLVDYARMKSIEPKPDNVTDFQIYPGEGIYGVMDGKRFYVGNKRIAARAGCVTVPSTDDMKDAVTLGYVFSSAVPIGMFGLSDTCRTGSLEAINELKSLSIKIAMLTGDSTVAAMHAQKQLGNAIEMLHAELLPEDKVRIVSDLKSNEGATVMVGDGLNDAPALAMANVGISMGISGSAVAMETSHITLMSNDIRKIPKVIRLAKRTHRKIIVNMFFSMITKVAVLALAIAGHPLLWAAVLADVGTCLLVILNSMMLLQKNTPKEEKCCGSHKSEGQCCGSLHEAHTHKHACTGGKCGSGSHGHDHGSAAHSCHDHGAVEDGSAHKHACSGGKCGSSLHGHDRGSAAHNCHDHGAAEEGSAHHDHSHCGSSHKAHKHCSGSTHKTHAHKPACGDHCGSKCGSGPHEHSSHGHEQKSHKNCSHSHSHSHSHYDPKSALDGMNNNIEHLISIPSGEEYLEGGLLGEKCRSKGVCSSSKACKGHNHDKLIHVKNEEHLISITDDEEHQRDELHKEHLEEYCKSDVAKEGHKHVHNHGHSCEHNHDHDLILNHHHNCAPDSHYDHVYDHDHNHNHHHHDYDHDHGHKCAHNHVHDNSHDHKHSKVHNHNHSHVHNHHDHESAHNHVHDHSHDHIHSHVHDHDHSHVHNNHDHKCTHDHDHGHKCAHNHVHDHIHPHVHDHDHSHVHNDDHDHSHVHNDNHDHKCTHDHDHSHDHNHDHDHDHDHIHSHVHDHDHSYVHNDNHDHKCTHDHDHNHNHAHDHDHKYPHVHNHGDAHNHDQNHVYAHSHSEGHKCALGHNNAHDDEQEVDHDHGHNCDHNHEHDNAHHHDHGHSHKSKKEFGVIGGCSMSYKKQYEKQNSFYGVGFVP